MIYETIKSDIVRAMKEKNVFVLQTLRTLDSEIQKKGLDAIRPTTLENKPEEFLRRDMIISSLDPRQKTYPDETVVGVLQKGIKQRQDSIEAFTKGNRLDLVQEEMTQMGIYQKYLPKQMTEDEIRVIVNMVIADTIGPTIGNVMKAVVPLTKGKADGKLVNKIVQESLK